MTLVAVIGAAVVLSAAGVGAMRTWTRRRGLLDVPNERSSHDRPVPRGGGLAMVGVVLVGAVAAAVCLTAGASALAGILGVALVAAVGWRDDVRPLPVSVRFAVQGLAAALVVGLGVPYSAAPRVVGAVSLGAAALLVAFVVLVGLTNAYNFMDGIDGIAGGQAVVAGFAWVVAGSLLGCRFEAIIGALIAGAAIGFLVHNLPPARIFMGDVGSGALGFLFAWLAVESGTRDSRLLVAGLVFVWPFIFDTAFTFLRRLGRRENVFRAHRSHLYQRLVMAGLSHGVVSAIYGSLAVVGACLALSWLYGVSNAGAGLLITLPSAGVGLVVTVLWKERHSSHDPRGPCVSS